MGNMKFRAVGAALAAIAIFGSTAAASLASEYEVQGLPEMGRCIKVETGTGTYEGAKCVTVETGNKGKYDFEPLTAGLAEIEKPTFSVTGGQTILTTVGLPSIICTAASISGEYTGPKSSTEKAVFSGCGLEGGGGASQPCQTGATAEQIEIPIAEGEIGFIKNQLKGTKRVVSVGLDLRPHSPSTVLITAICAPGKTKTETVVVEGSVIAQITPIDKTGTKLSLKYKATTNGHQVPEKFEGGLKDTLATTVTGLAGSFSGASTLSILTVTGTNSTPLEIKAK